MSPMFVTSIGSATIRLGGAAWDNRGPARKPVSFRESG